MYKLSNMLHKAAGVARKAIGVASIALAPAAAFAQTTIDTSGVLTQVTAASAAVLAIGAAVVAGPKIAVKVYKWVGRAL